MSLSKGQRDELVEFRKKRQCDDDSGKPRKKASLDKSNKDAINISYVIQSEFVKRANKDKVDTTKLYTDMKKLLTFIDKDVSEKSTTSSSVADAATSQGTFQALKSASRTIVGKANNDMRRK